MDFLLFFIFFLWNWCTTSTGIRLSRNWGWAGRLLTTVGDGSSISLRREVALVSGLPACGNSSGTSWLTSSPWTWPLSHTRVGGACSNVGRNSGLRALQRCVRRFPWESRSTGRSWQSGLMEWRSFTVSLLRCLTSHCASCLNVSTACMVNWTRRKTFLCSICPVLRPNAGRLG